MQKWEVVDTKPYQSASSQKWEVVDTKPYSQSNVMPTSNPNYGASGSINTNLPTKGASSIGDDLMNMIYQGLSQAPGAAIDTVKGLPSELYGAARQISTDPKRAINNIVSGLAMPGRAVANAPSDIMNYLSQKGLVNPQKAQNIPRSPLDKTNIPEFFGVQGQQSGDAALQSSGYLPFGIAGEAGALTGAARAGARAGGAGAYAASQGQNPVTGALLGPTTEGIVRSPIVAAQGAVSGVNKLKPSALLSGNLSNEELARNLQVADGTDTLLGDVIGSPTVKQKYENIVSKITGSGADKKYRKIAGQVEEKAGDIVKNLEKNSGINFTGENQGEQIKNVILGAKEKARDQKNQFYRRRDNIAAQEGFLPDLSGTIKLAKENKDHLLSTPALLSVPGMNKLFNTSKKVSSQGKEQVVQDFDPKYINMMNALKKQGVSEKDIATVIPGYKPENTSTLEPLNLTDATNLKSSFYKMAEDFSKPTSSGSDLALGRQFRQLYDQLDKDIKSSIETKASSKLKNSHANATENFKDDYLQYLDSDLHGMFNQQKPHDLITQQVIRPGAKADAYTRIQKVNEMLPKENKNILGAAYLQPAFDKEGKLDVNEMDKLINQLGNTQFKHLFDEPTRARINDFQRLKKMNGEALNRMANPKNGSRALDSFIMGMQALAGGAAIGGVHAALPVAGGLIAPSYLAGKTTKYLSDPKFRENIVKKIIEHQDKLNAKKSSSMTSDQKQKYMNYVKQGVVPYGINQNKGNQ